MVTKKSGRSSNLSKEDRVKGGEHSHKASRKSHASLSSKKTTKK